MTVNAAILYGRDIACVLDADAFFTEAVGVDVVRQDAIHRILTDDVLGENGTGWGFDCRRLIGMSASKLATMQPLLSEVLTRDERILSADVTLTATITRGLADVAITAICMTDAGPFTLTESVLDLTAAALNGQAQ